MAWEDPKQELAELGITQKGVIFRIAKALDAYKAKSGGKKRKKKNLAGMIDDCIFNLFRSTIRIAQKIINSRYSTTTQACPCS